MCDRLSRDMRRGNSMIEAVRQLWPELEWIQDPDLRDRVAHRFVSSVANPAGKCV